MQKQEYGATAGSSLLPSSNYAAVKTLGAAASQASGVALTILIAATCLVAPWTIFTVNLWLLSFSMRYSHPQLCVFSVLLTGCLVILCAIRAYYLYRKRRPGELRREIWHMFFTLTAAIGWVLGVVLGMTNYSSNMAHFYDITSLALYPNVDPAKANGQQLLDMGRVIFTKESHLAMEKSFTFKDYDLYCVAPIVSGDARFATYDFWAVGTNCCKGQGDFKCGDALNPLAHAGVRLLDEYQASKYRRAVTQAEAMYGIRANHPLFIHWVEDPINKMSHLQDSGLKFFLLCTLTFFGLQLFFVALASASSRIWSAMLLK